METKYVPRFSKQTLSDQAANFEIQNSILCMQPFLWNSFLIFYYLNMKPHNPSDITSQMWWNARILTFLNWALTTKLWAKPNQGHRRPWNNALNIFLSFLSWALFFNTFSQDFPFFSSFFLSPAWAESSKCTTGLILLISRICMCFFFHHRF